MTAAAIFGWFDPLVKWLIQELVNQASPDPASYAIVRAALAKIGDK